MTEFVVDVHPDGTIRHLVADELQFLMTDPALARTARASRVEPTADNRWTADLTQVGGPVLGPFTLRGEAVAAEVAWLEAHGLPMPGDKPN